MRRSVRVCFFVTSVTLSWSQSNVGVAGVVASPATARVRSAVTEAGLPGRLRAATQTTVDAAQAFQVGSASLLRGLLLYQPFEPYHCSTSGALEV